MNRFSKNFLRILLPFVVLAIGLFIAVLLIKSRKKPAKEDHKSFSIPVEITPIHRTSEAITVEAAGTVLPSRRIELRPQVGGMILTVHDALQPGGFLREGEALLRIDPRDYEYAVERQRSQVEQARFELVQEQGRAKVAEREWSILGKELEISEEGKDLALRKPHLRRANAALTAAKSALAEAELNLERTVVRAPFNCLILRESVDPGQLVNSQTVAAVLTGTDQYWVQASTPVDRLGFFDLPDLEGQEGASAKIVYETGAGRTSRTGRVIRLLGDLDEAGRMARLLIEIDDPQNLAKAGRQDPLLLDAYVRVEIKGKPLDDVFAIPSQALREGDRVWVANASERLEIRDVRVVWREEQRVLVREGLSDGDRVITSRIGTPIPDMKLKIIARDEPLSTTAGEAAHD